MRHTAAVGSTAVVTDQNGVKVDDCDYLPYGQMNCITSSSGNHYLYTGLERDADQLDHTLHRQYSSSFGRWMSPDPGGVKVVNMDTPQTWNMYAYVADNPTTDTDPTGLSGQYNTNGGCATLRNCTDDRQRVATAAGLCRGPLGVSMSRFTRPPIALVGPNLFCDGQSAPGDCTSGRGGTPTGSGGD